MVKLELELSDIDYDQLLNTFLPKMQEKLGPNSALSSLLGGGLAGSLMSMAGNSTKDKLAADPVIGEDVLARQGQKPESHRGPRQINPLTGGRPSCQLFG